MRVEKSEMISWERYQKRGFSKGGPSIGKRTREYQVEWLHNSSTRGRRQGPTITSSTDRGISTGQGEILECPHCHKRHSSNHIWLTIGCFRCGNTDHLLANCPREPGAHRNPLGSGRGGLNAPPMTRDRGSGRGGSRQHRGSTVSETVDHPITTAPAQAYAMKAREYQDAPEVIVGIFSLYNTEMHALIDPSSIHSYVCTEHSFDKIPLVEQLAYDIHVTSPLRHSISVNRVYKICLIMIHDREFFADLIELSFHEFDLILGMDWLSNHRVIILCDKKTVVLKCSDQSKVIVHGIQSGPLSNVISAMQARRLLKNECEAFLALLLDSKQGQVKLEDIPVVKEFSDVFSEELPSLPPEREVDLPIEFLSGTAPISKAPYRMAPNKLKELKNQL